MSSHDPEQHVRVGDYSHVDRVMSCPHFHPLPSLALVGCMCTPCFDSDVRKDKVTLPWSVVSSYKQFAGHDGRTPRLPFTVTDPLMTPFAEPLFPRITTFCR